MNRICIECGVEFKLTPRKPGKIDHCPLCAEEVVVPYTGNMIYAHKTGSDIQINKDPRLTAYLNGEPVEPIYKAEDSCLVVAEPNVNAKGHL